MSDHYDRYNGMENLLGTNLAEISTNLARTVKGFPIDADLLMLKVEEKYGFRARDRLYEIIRNMPKYELPSAQPEIIRCKDCKYWIPYDWMFSEVWQSQNIDDYPEDEISCNYCDVHMKSSDFCSQAVRREVTT